MSDRINFNRNIFLEKEELVRFQSFLENNTVNQVMLENTSSWGIVRTVFTGTSPDFKIEVGTNSGTVKLATASKAVDKNKMLIKSKVFDNLAVPATGLYYWIKISHQYSNLEEGTCTVNTSGQVSGAQTKFTDVVRGQSSEVPVKIKFWKSAGLVNTGTYEVIDVAGDGTMTLVGSSFSAESNLNYFVVGSTPIGEAITAQQLLGLYFYDSCKIEFVQETTLNTAPAGLNADVEFYIARVKNTAGTIELTDKRTQFITFNVEGMSDKLSKTANLSDLDDVAEARDNLGVMSSQEINDTFFRDSGWKNMVRGVAAQTSDFDIKIRRVGKLCIVQGTFMNNNGAVNSIIASIPYSEIYAAGETVLGPSELIRFQCGPQIASSNSENYGLFGKILARSVNETSLYLKVEERQGTFGAKFNINFSFFLG